MNAGLLIGLLVIIVDLEQLSEHRGMMPNCIIRASRHDAMRSFHALCRTLAKSKNDYKRAHAIETWSMHARKSTFNVHYWSVQSVLGNCVHLCLHPGKVHFYLLHIPVCLVCSIPLVTFVIVEVSTALCTSVCH